ncbi:ATP-binding cassette domain-containing protein [uncultured Tenacibaculum sp.]|uniref:ABC transporter ATP-binding protein n=1 Tax=uncultured Tenacibaculum sp. TaxID=174713 RepID=UPI002637D1A8|nr:ATP-binding cassette domain-containing protein [uncultured Tenacibaculum sp.]
MKNTAIKIENLSFSYSKKQKALKNLNINVPKGAIYGFLGANGAGKSTTMQLLTGILSSSKKNVFLFEKELQSQFPFIFSKIGALVETPSLYLHLTGIDNLRCITKLKEVSEDKISEVLGIVGLSDKGHLKVKQYSLGMKQRLAIAMTLLGEPELLLLDEPVNGLDPTGITEIRELLVKLNKEKGTTIFISSHLLSEIEKMCTHIGIIDKGELKFEGSIEELESLTKKYKILVKTKDISTNIELIKNSYKDVRKENNDCVMIELNSKEEIPVLTKFLITNDIPVYEIKIVDGLEEWFLSLTK